MALAGIAGVFFAIMGIKAYRPQAVEIVYKNDTAALVDADTIVITTWNIGYAGMDADADFFMDGGKMVRRPEPQVRHNLQKIASTLHNINSHLLLLQEVDLASRRSYYVNQFGVIGQYLRGWSGFFALTFNVLFVPVPVWNPIGRAKSGIAVFGRWQPAVVERRAYPNPEAPPARWFNLQRCFMACRFRLAGQKELVVINTHNSAFDNGNARRDEVMFLKQFLENEYERGNYVIAGGDWNQTPPQRPCLAATPQYAPVALPPDFLPDGWTIAADTLPTARFANKPYHPDVSLTAGIDFFVLSPNVIAAKDASVLPLHFAHSDHNPVQISIILRRQQ